MATPPPLPEKLCHYRVPGINWPPVSRVAFFRSTAFWIPFAASFLSILVLFGFVPYCSGYGSVRWVFSHAIINHWLHQDQGEWLHGMFVPFLALFLLWNDREALLAMPVRPSHSGLVVILAGFLLYWFGYVADIEYFGSAALQILLAGLILWFLGVAAMRRLLFPWAFLLFMYPMPFLDSIIALRLRLVMSHGTHVLLNLLGIANLQVGTSLVSAPDLFSGLAQGARFGVDVANPCSGIRSLYALVMVSALYAWFTLDRPWKKGLLILAAAPLAILGNMARLLLLVFGTLLWGTDFAIGPLDSPSWFHEAAGWLVFFVALGGMYGVGRLLDVRWFRLADVSLWVKSMTSPTVPASTPVSPEEEASRGRSRRSSRRSPGDW